MQMPTGVVLRRTADLVPYANNARTHTPEQGQADRRLDAGVRAAFAIRRRAANSGVACPLALSIAARSSCGSVHRSRDFGISRRGDALDAARPRLYHGLESLVIAGQERHTDYRQGFQWWLAPPLEAIAAAMQDAFLENA